MIGKTNASGGGGASLNFFVVGGITEPTNPKENTIWVNTDIAITDWSFSAEEPTNPGEGMVWFQTGSSATAAFNALKKNNITVYPTGCKQCVSGAWAERAAKIYQGGVWVDWWAGEIYDNGNEHTDITGGWVAKGIQGSAGGKTAPTLTKNGDNMVVNMPSGGGDGTSGIVTTNSEIDLTNYSTVTFKAHGNVPLYCHTALVVYKLSTTTIEHNNNYSGVAAYTKLTGTFGEDDYSVDVSGLNGNYAVGVFMHNGGSQGHDITINKVKLG